jgi:uncharacterized protein
MNYPLTSSRRQWIRTGLVTCGYLASGGFMLGQSEERPAPKCYTRPGSVTVRVQAPGLQTRLVNENLGGEKTYFVIFPKGDEILSGLTEFAKREKITAGYFTSIGALRSARFGLLDVARKSYRNIPINQQVELISLNGHVGLANGAPQIHVHGAVGLPDGHLRGEHILEAIAWQTVEVFFTACSTTLIKKYHEETNLFLFDLKS